MRTGHVLLALLLSLAAKQANAQFAMSAGLEYFAETEDTSPIQVRERGPLLTFGLAFTQPKQRGFLFAYRGKFYAGAVDYNGALLFQPDVPTTSTTHYTGTYQEGQLRYRFGTGLDVLGAAGVDLWRRELSSNQKEDYAIGYVRLGVESSTTAQKGWLFGAGVKYPFVTRENAYFTDLGYDQNPTLKPGKDISVFGQLGYRFVKNWALIGYLDSFRFKESDVVFVTRNGVPAGGFFQPATDIYVVGLKVEYQF